MAKVQKILVILLFVALGLFIVLGALVLSAEREQREGLSEGGGVLQVMRLARVLGLFF